MKSSRRKTLPFIFSLLILLACQSPNSLGISFLLPTSTATTTQTPTLIPAASQTPTAALTQTPTLTATVTLTATLTDTPSSTITPTFAAPARRVVIVSIDGLRPDAIFPASMSNLITLMQSGAFSLGAQTVFPSVTLVAHASMLSGLCPSKHGLLWNEYLPERGYAQGTDLFDLAHAAGLKTIMYVSSDKIRQIVEPASLDRFLYIEDRDSVIMGSLVAHFPQDFGLLFVHLVATDIAGHLSGWMSPYQLDTIHLADEALGMLLTELDARNLFGEQLPAFMTTIVSNILLLAGPSLFYIALSQFTGFTYNKAFVSGILAAALAFLLYFTYWADDLGKRMITFSLGSVALVLLLILQLWQIQKTALRFSANLMLVSFLIHALFLILRTISTILDPPQETLSLSRVQSATYLLSFAISFFWSIGFVLMVSHRLRNDLMEIATIDVLTRVPNRRATQSFLEKELSRAHRYQTEFSVLLIDIDNFKQVNDRWGHAVGDEVLVKTARLFQSMIRKQDLVGRWGGEEFLIILPGPCDAEMLAERVRSEVARAEYRHGAASFHITVSIGIACVTPPTTGDEILKQADEALYTAKRIKNTVKLATPTKM